MTRTLYANGRLEGDRQERGVYYYRRFDEPDTLEIRKHVRKDGRAEWRGAVPHFAEHLYLHWIEGDTIREVIEDIDKLYDERAEWCR